MILGQYVLDLYCDVEGCFDRHGNLFHAQFAVSTKTRAWSCACKNGWKRVGNRVICRLCQAEGHKLPRSET